MKKILSTVALGFFLLLGTTVVQAQGLTVSNDRPEAIAKELVSKISEKMDLTGDQERALFRAYVKREVGIKKHVADKDISSPAVKQQVTLLDNDLVTAVKKELTPEQFQEWKKEFIKASN